MAMGGCAADVDLDDGDEEIADDSAALGSLEYDLATDHSPFEEATAGRSAEHDASWGRAFFEKDGEKWETVIGERDLVSVPPGVYRGLVNERDEEALMCVMLGAAKPTIPTYPPDHPLAKIDRGKKKG